MTNDTKDDKDYSEVFLATTARDEFWDISKELVLLGPWCLSYRQQSKPKALDHKMMPSPWEDRQNFIKAYNYVQDVYNRLLLVLVNSLNDLHKTQHSIRYWEIVLGPWLHHFISILFDRYICIKNALNKYPNFQTILLSEDSFLTMPNTDTYIDASVRSDVYNLQIFSKILTGLGKQFPRKEFSQIIADSLIKKNNPLKHWLSKLLKRIPLESKLVLYAAYFPFFTKSLFFIKTGGKILSLIPTDYDYSNCPVNFKMRKTLEEMSLAKNEFEHLLVAILPGEMPMAYIEQYNDIQFAMTRYYNNRPAVILSAIGWYFDETFKIWAADCQEKGTILIGQQHGGNYGVAQYMSLENLELSMTDYYCTWGWNGPTNCTINLPAGKLMRRSKMNANNKKEGILFTTTTMHRYLYRFQQGPLPNEIDEYLNWQFIFYNCLDVSIKKYIRLRLHNSDYGWNAQQRWKENFSEIKIESWKIPYLESLKNCRLYVCDHLSTTYLEALAVNKPTILFWNPLTNEIRGEAAAVFQKLKDAGILHNSPEAAAQTVNKVYNDVEQWWNNDKRQDAVKDFCQAYARTSKNSENEWINWLKSFLRKD